MRPVDRADRVLSWVATEHEQEDRRRHANRLVGSRLRSVRYFDIDYERERWADGITGPRQVENPKECREPAWRNDACDSVDFGVEIETTDGHLFTVTWDPPGQQEGIGLRQAAAIGYACSEDAGVAVWDVTRRGRWHSFLRRDITAVVLHYEPWSEEEGFWCPRITVQFGASAVEFLLAEPDTNGEIQPSGDNVAVLFAPNRLPAWRQPAT